MQIGSIKIWQSPVLCWLMCVLFSLMAILFFWAAMLGQKSDDSEPYFIGSAFGFCAVACVFMALRATKKRSNAA